MLCYGNRIYLRGVAVNADDMWMLVPLLAVRCTASTCSARTRFEFTETPRSFHGASIGERLKRSWTDATRNKPMASLFVGVFAGAVSLSVPVGAAGGKLSVHVLEVALTGILYTTHQVTQYTAFFIFHRTKARLLAAIRRPTYVHR